MIIDHGKNGLVCETNKGGMWLLVLQTDSVTLRQTHTSCKNSSTNKGCMLCGLHSNWPMAHGNEEVILHCDQLRVWVSTQEFTAEHECGRSDIWVIQSTETTDYRHTHSLYLPTYTYIQPHIYIHHPRYYTDTAPTPPTISAATNQHLLYVRPCTVFCTAHYA